MGFRRRSLLQMLTYALGSGFVLPRSGFAMVIQNPAPPAGSPSAKAGDTPQAEIAPTERVAGIGGVFFRAHDPATLGKWYRENLGIGLTTTSHGARVWEQEAGPTSFTPFPETTKYFGDPNKAWMLNFRVHDMEKMAAQLRAKGIEVKLYPEDAAGRFARLHDPEGNPIELWQPAKAGA